MYKRLLFVLFPGLLAVPSQAQTSAAKSRRIDTVAVAILDRMSAMVGDLGSCSFTVKSNYDVSSKELGLIKHSDEEQLFLHGPNKMLIKSEGDRGSRDLYFDGKKLNYYSQDKNQYGQVEAGMTLVEMIDTVNKLYGIDFPAADFLYPTFVDDILAESKELVYLGLTKVEGKECYHIAGRGQDKTYQFWISDDAFSLPLKMVIVYTNKEMDPQYEAIFSDWQVNPNLPDALFEFAVPHKAKRVRMVPMSHKK
ncbi:MAG TPA: DUF2092 domain-containing protein [Puia sp.]|nr:DUF2092 domain-containing protein [Puia sp.]